MTAQQLADIARTDFVGTKRVLLRDVSREKRTQRQVLVLLRKRFEILQRNYLREDGTTYEAWLEHGPKDELDEVLEAARDASVWDRLVDKHAPKAE